MKTAIGVAVGSIAIVGLIVANLMAGDQLVLQAGNRLNSYPPYYAAPQSVTSSAQVTFSSITYGVQRTFENQGAGKVMVSLSSSSIPTAYLTLNPGEKRTMDKYFGAVYMESITGTNAVQCEYIRTNN